MSTVYSAVAERTTPATVLEVRRIRKAFGHVQALDQVDLRLAGGEVLALVGDNGAGKSTLVKILAGALVPDAGEIYVNGELVSLTSPRDALRLGIATVFQDLSLVETREVAANLFLGREFVHGAFGWFVDRARCRREAESLLRRLGAHLPSMAVNVELLSGGQRQAIAIARAVAEGGRVIIMDEPTAALGVTQSRQVLQLISGLRNDGLSIIVITHNISHAFEVADRVQVLHRGRVAGVRQLSSTNAEEIVRLITLGATGAEIGAQSSSEEGSHGL